MSRTVPSHVVNVGLAVCFVAVYYLGYVLFLHPWFGYFGFALYPRSNAFLMLTVLVAVSPIVLYQDFRALSSAIAVFIYLILYVPIVLTFGLASSRPVGDIVIVQLVFMACMCVLFLTDRVIIRSPLKLDTELDLIPMVLVATVISTLYLLFVYRGHLRLVSFGEAVYAQRAATADVGGGLVTRYLSAWLATALTPLCLAHGLFTRNWKYFGAGSAACVVIYMAVAAKVMIILPFVYVALYLLFSGGRLRKVYPISIVSLLAFILVMLAITGADVGGIIFLVSSILLSRTVGNGGLVTLAYYDFFTFHPQTDYSHINLVRMLFGSYPYGTDGLGQVVGQYYWSADMNANANFWATDGLAALGLLGVPVVTVVCALLFVAINSFTRAYDQLFVLLCFVPFVQYLLNTSLFTSLWSGGAIFLLLFFMFNKRAQVSATGNLGPAVASPTFEQRP